jgi:hypothetical protein
MLANMVLETTTNPGTNTTVNLAGAVSGFSAFASGFSNGASIYYVLRDGGQWETGSGTFNTGSPNTISRTTVISNSAGNTSRLNFTGLTQVYNVTPASRSVYTNNSGLMQNVTATGISGPVWGGGAGGTANALTISPTPAITSYVAGQIFFLGTGASPNTGNVTLNVNGLGAQGLINATGVSQLAPGTLRPDTVLMVLYDGANFRLLSPRSEVFASSINGGPLAGLRNAIINGNFDIWQRGTSISIAGTTTYTADRWASFFNGTGATRTVSRQSFTAGQTDVPNEPRYFLRWDQTAAGSGSTFNTLEQRIENVRTFAGQTVTFSFWARAAVSATLPNVRIFQRFGTGGSPSTQVQTDLGTSIIVGTSWVRYSFSVTLPSLAGKTFGSDENDYLAVSIGMPLNTTFTIDIAQAQLERGGIATPFEMRPIGLERNLCYRYYYAPPSSAAFNVTGYSGGPPLTIYHSFSIPQEMRPGSITADITWSGLTNASSISSRVASAASFESGISITSAPGVFSGVVAYNSFSAEL